MKSFKEKLAETVDKIKSPDEQNFADKHIVDKQDHPVAKDDQFTTKKSDKAKRKADHEDDKAVYEETDAKDEMSDAQKKKKEEIVKSMKKKMGEFKDRYGDDAENVMHATATKMAMKEEECGEDHHDLSEAVIDDLRKIVKTKSRGTVKFADGSKLPVDMFTASAMTKVHDALNSANQKKFADAINKNENMFMKMMDFAMSGGKKK